MSLFLKSVNTYKHFTVLLSHWVLTVTSTDSENDYDWLLRLGVNINFDITSVDTLSLET